MEEQVASPETLVREFRRQMPIADRWAYFDHAAVAPIPCPVADAMRQWLDEATHQGDTCWPQWAQRVEETRREAAALINADTAEIALVPNTTTGINLVARGRPWQSGDNVVVPDNEFPSNLYPWLSLNDLGVEVRRVPVENGALDIERLLATCNERTRLIAVSWVGYVSGWRIDVAELCRAAHERGIAVMLDAIQGLGVFPLDVRTTEVDFVAADGHKWMLGPEGGGLLYVRRDRLRELKPLHAGWNSVVGRYDFSVIDWKPREEAARYEGGSQNIAGMIGFGASLKMLRRLGVGPHSSPVADVILNHARLWRRELQSLGAEFLSPYREGADSGILTFMLPGVDSLRLRNRCLEAGVVCSVRGGGVRLSPHAYNNGQDFERLMEVCRRESSENEKHP